MNSAGLVSTVVAAFLVAAVSLPSGAAPGPTRPGEEVLRRQLKAETDRLEARCLQGVRTLEDWSVQRPEWRRQLADMLGLWPVPPRTDLKSVVTGTNRHDGFIVENVQFQSRPGLYVTGNLYRPEQVTGPLPTILYLSGHGPVISNGVSYGNKVSYQHHGAWFARNGYVCLIIDSVQLGEILGLHHGTYRENLWWWNARGYSPAGAEAWNCIRALDYLSTRPEVDTNRFGATGRSGGGAYSWWVAALDQRIKVVAPVAGITDLHNHVVDGTVEGHCDCMFMVNTYRWDYPQVAALVAPRPLLIVNTDADSIFPLDGVQRLHAKVRDIYRLHDAADKLGLVIGPGPHKDTQDLQVPVFRWFNRHLKGVDPSIEMAARPFCTPEELRVFQTLPTDSINTNLHETFVPAAAAAPIPTSKRAWETARDQWLQSLREQCFAGWPQQAPAAALTQLWSVKKAGVRFEAFEFLSEEGLPLRIYAVSSGGRRAREIRLSVLGESGAGETFDDWLDSMAVEFREELSRELTVAGREITLNPDGFSAIRHRLSVGDPTLAWLAPRGVGLTAWSSQPKDQTQFRRRFMLLGQTLDGMRVWDIRRALQAVSAHEDWRSASLFLAASGALACDALYASLYAPVVPRLDLSRLPVSHRAGPDYLNVLKVLDVPQALAMAVERGDVILRDSDQTVADYAKSTMRQVGWSRDRLRVNSPLDPR